MDRLQPPPRRRYVKGPEDPEAADLRLRHDPLLSLAVLVVALWAIDSYAFHGRYRAAALEDINYYAQTFNNGVQSFVNRIRP